MLVYVGALLLILGRRSALLAYLVSAGLSAVAVQTWFEPGTVIASGDLPPPVAPEANYTSHWSHLAAGEGAPAYTIVGLPYAAWLDVWTWLGADEALGQRLWLTSLFAASAAAVVFLAFGFTTSSVAAGTAGLLASFSAYRLVTGPDTIPMVAVLVAALLGGLVVRAALRPERKTSVLGFAVASVGLGHVMSNPSHVALVVIWVAVCFVIVLVATPAAAGRTFGFLAKAAPLALLFNAWWIAPAWLTVTGPGFADRFAAAGVDEWAWTQGRATLANALTLNTAWGWSYPEYFPYADRLDDLPYNLLRLYLPVLAAVGVVLARRGERRIALSLAVTALAAAWLATGLRAPVPETNRWLYDHAPGYWLFREPSKILLLVLLPVAVLGGLGVRRLLDVGPGTLAPRALAAGLLAGAVLYVHPLFTGDVVPDDRPLLPPAHVRVPDAWRQAATALNGYGDGGKVLILPRSDFYQVPTTWGYYGTSFSRPMIRRPVLETGPGGYFRPAETVSLFQESVESDLLSGDVGEVRKKLSALGVRYILLRRDVDPDFPERRIARPEVLARGLTRVRGVRMLRSFGMLELYRVAGESGDEVFATTPTFYAGDSHAIAPTVSVVRGRPGFLTDEDDQRSVVHAGVRATRFVRFEEGRVRRLAVKTRRGMLLVRLFDPFRLSIGGRELPDLPSQTMAVPLPENSPFVVTAGNVVLPLRRPPQDWLNLGLVGLGERESVSVWEFAGSQLLGPSSGGPVGDCNAFDDRSMEEVGIRADVVPSAGRPTLRLSARAHSACVTFPVAPTRSADVYAIRFRYRQVQGSRPRACLWQAGVEDCAAMPELRPGRTWQTFDAAIRPHDRATALTLFLYADGSGGKRTTVAEYQPIRVERYRRVASLPPTRPRVQGLPADVSSQTSIAFVRPLLSRRLDLAKAGPVGDCNRYDRRSPAELGLAARVLSGSGSPILQLAARDHSACVDFAVSPFAPGSRAYRIRFEYRRLSGNRPRACLWLVGPDRCVPFSDLHDDREWRVVDRTVRLDPNVRAMRLFLYADGGGDRRTVTEYREVHVAPLSSVAIVGLPKTEPLPNVVARREAPWKFRVRVRNARAPFLLATTEGYDPGWKVRADGRDASALRHVRVNGYANGWLVPWKGSYDLVLEYEPERYARAARWLSVIAPVWVFGWIARRRIRRSSRQDTSKKQARSPGE